MKKLFFIIILFLLPISVNADVVEIEGIYYNLISKTKEAEVAKGEKNYGGNVVIPEKIVFNNEDYTVTTIGESAFSYNMFGDLEIWLPKTIKRINSGAFMRCNALKAVHINDLESWCNIAFNDSPTLYAHHLFLNGEEVINVDYPESISTVHAHVFEGLVNLNTVNLHEGITQIGGEAFYGCTNLTQINIPSKVERIGDSAFCGCSNLENVVLPDSVTTIGNSAFRYCTLLKHIIIPKSVKSLSSSAFWGCSNLETIIVDSENEFYDSRDNCNAIIESSSNVLLIGCQSSLIPNGVLEICNNSFHNCIGLMSINIPNSVRVIGSNSFDGCSNLTLVSLGNSIEKINSLAFANCKELTDVYCYSRDVPKTAGDAFNNSYISSATLHVLEASQESYKSTKPWGNFGNIVKLDIPKHSLIYLIDGDEYKKYEIEEGEPIVPEPAPTKEGYTFSGWSDIPETMPAKDVTVTGTFSINKYKLTYIVDNEVYKTDSLVYGVTITPEPAPTKEGYTFSGWSDIPETMPANDVVVTGSFSAIVIKEDKGEFTATSGSTAELSNDDNVSGEYEIPETVTYDGVTYTVISIGNEAFKDNTNLTDITIPSTITSIGESAFAGCSNLKSITVNSAMPIAFSSASRTRGGSSVFEGVDKTTCILYVPEGSVDLYKAAPVWSEFQNILAIGSSGINGTIKNDEPQDIYDLQGHKVKAKATSLEGLPRGIYIVNGKKLVLK